MFFLFCLKWLFGKAEVLCITLNVKVVSLQSHPLILIGWTPDSLEFFRLKFKQTNRTLWI